MSSLSLAVGVGLMCALLSALATNLAFLFKHRGAVAAPDVDMRHPLRSAIGLFRSKWWSIGWAVPLALFTSAVGAVDGGLEVMLSARERYAVGLLLRSQAGRRRAVRTELPPSLLGVRSPGGLPERRSSSRIHARSGRGDRAANGRRSTKPDGRAAFASGPSAHGGWIARHDRELRAVRTRPA